MTSVHIYLSVLGLLVWSSCVIDARPSFSRSARQRLVQALRSRRTQYCVSSSGTCFTSAQCCPGLVCASFDYYIGDKPEVPGNCVREKDLEPCEDNDDCQSGTRCLPLGRSSELYCMPVLNHRPAVVVANNNNNNNGHEDASLVGGRLGALCQTDNDCAEMTADRSSRLCCQDVRRGRQGVRRQCDRYHERLSVCIGPNGPAL